MIPEGTHQFCRARRLYSFPKCYCAGGPTSVKRTVGENPLSGPVNCHHFSLKHAVVVRQTKCNVQTQFPRVYTASNPIFKFRAVDIYSGLPGGDIRIGIPVIPIWKQKVENLTKQFSAGR